MTEINDAASEIAADMPDDSDVTVEDIESELTQLIEDFSTPLNDAKRIVRRNNDALGNTGPTGDADGNPIEKGVEELDTDKQLITIEVKCLQQWEPRHDSIEQVGLVGDASGKNKFTGFKGNGNEVLEEGESYRISHAITNHYQGDYSVQFTDDTEFEKLDKEIEVDDNTMELTGPIVSVNEYSSGFIERCSEEDCTRVLDNGRCKEHGKVDGIDDLRMKATVDTSTEYFILYFNAEQVEELTGIGLEEAEEIAADAMNRDAVLPELNPYFLGHYFQIEGRDIGENNNGQTRVKVKNATTEFDTNITEQADELIERANEVSA